MSYKTILVHLNHEPRARRLLAPAIELARHFEAHLIGLYAFPAFGVLPFIHLPIDEEANRHIREAIGKREDAIKEAFDEMTAGQPFVSEWRAETTERRGAALTVLDHAREVDLVIAGQADPNWHLSYLQDFPEQLALGAGRPVIVIPNQGRHKGVPGNIVIAWNDSRESARAVADALPLLKSADKVHLLTIGEDGQQASNRSSADIEKALIRHSVNLTAARALATEFTTGEEIRVRAIDLEADLIVMGCYGHSRVREFALGGVTRHLIRDMTIPILFSH